MSLENNIEEYIKKHFLLQKDEEGKQNTIEDWNSLKQETKDLLRDLIINFPLLRDLILYYNSQEKFEDVAFARDIKLLIKNHLK